MDWGPDIIGIVGLGAMGAIACLVSVAVLGWVAGANWCKSPLVFGFVYLFGAVGRRSVIFRLRRPCSLCIRVSILLCVLCCYYRGSIRAA